MIQQDFHFFCDIYNTIDEHNRRQHDYLPLIVSNYFVIFQAVIQNVL